MNSQTIKDIGYLILRLGLGAAISRFGWPKIAGGVSKWEDIGHSMQVIGITVIPVFWGFCAAVSEFVGGICIAVGVLFRPACALIIFVMLIAVLNNIGGKNTFYDWDHAAEFGIAFLAMFLMGPGRFSLSVSLNK